MQRYTTSCGLEFDFLLKRSRRKTIGFHILPHGLEIRVPHGIRQSQLERAIESKKDWLENNLNALQQRQQRWLEHSAVWCESGIFPFLGHPVQIQFASCTHPYPKTKDEHIQRLYIPHSANTKEVYSHCKNWLQEQARKKLAKRLQWWSDKHHIKYQRFTLGWSKRSWGWCKNDGSIMLNWRLIYYPLHLIDYVVAHELTHINHMHHGPEFWRALKNIYPE